MWKFWKQRQPEADVGSVDAGGAGASASDPLLELATRAQAGDRAAASQLLLALTPYLLRVARQTLGASHPEVNDVAQEAAFGVLTALPRFRGECTLVHFACRIAVLTAMNTRRRELAETRKSQGFGVLALVDGSEQQNPEQAAQSARALHAVRELLGSLPPAQAEVLGLHHVVGMTAAEIAAATRAPLETVRSRLRLGRQALRQRVLGDERFLEAVGIGDGNAG
jgi:RNA polymerase sigma factor (sigma-70 family)